MIMLIYIAKVVFFYALGGLLVTTLTSGLDPLDPAAWWDEPIVYQKLVLWTVLVEVLGIGGAWGPLTGHFKPMTGGVRYWAHPKMACTPEIAPAHPLVVGGQLLDRPTQSTCNTRSRRSVRRVSVRSTPKVRRRAGPTGRRAFGNRLPAGSELGAIILHVEELEDEGFPPIISGVLIDEVLHRVGLSIETPVGH